MNNWTETLRALKAYVNRQVAQVRVAAIFGLGSLTDKAGRWLVSAQGGLGEALTDVELLQHYGLRTAPGSGRFVAVQLGGRGGRWVGVAELDPDAPTPEPGEVILYAAAGQRITLDADGHVRIDPGDGGQVVFVGGTQAVARVGDSVTITGTAGPYTITASGVIAGGNEQVLA